jgi:hypothetical protein
MKIHNNGQTFVAYTYRNFYDFSLSLSLSLSLKMFRVLWSHHYTVVGRTEHFRKAFAQSDCEKY